MTCSIMSAIIAVTRRQGEILVRSSNRQFAVRAEACIGQHELATHSESAGRPIPRSSQRASTTNSFYLSLRKMPMVIGIGLCGIALRYLAYYLETRNLSVGGYLEALCNWDCTWIRGVASEGYALQPRDNGEANWAFFPLLPMLVAWLHAVTKLSLTICGAVVSQTCIGLAAVFAAALFKDENQEYSLFCVLLIAGPLSFYYSTGLSEALFVMLTVLVLVCLRQGAYLSAGAAAGLLSATRVTGVFILLAIAWQAFIDYRRGTLPVGRALAACALAPTGLFVFMAYLHVRTGDALAFAHIQSAWHRSLGNPLVRLWDGLATGLAGLEFWFAVTALVALAMSFIIAIRGSIGVALFCAASIILALSSGLASMPRYVAGLAPLTIVTAQLFAYPRLLRIAVAALGAAIGIFATMKWIGSFQFLV
jgi:hypothetical protein